MTRNNDVTIRFSGLKRIDFLYLQLIYRVAANQTSTGVPDRVKIEMIIVHFIYYEKRKTGQTQNDLGLTL